jgi:hypothetical protein
MRPAAAATACHHLLELMRCFRSTHCPLHSRSAHLRFRLNMYKLREEREIKPATFGHMVSSMLYEKRCGWRASHAWRWLHR